MVVRLNSFLTFYWSIVLSPSLSPFYRTLLKIPFTYCLTISILCAHLNLFFHSVFNIISGVTIFGCLKLTNFVHFDIIIHHDRCQHRAHFLLGRLLPFPLLLLPVPPTSPLPEHSLEGKVPQFCSVDQISYFVVQLISIRGVYKCPSILSPGTSNDGAH